MKKESFKQVMENKGKKEQLLGEKKGIKLWGGIIILLLVAAFSAYWFILRDGEAGAKGLSGSKVVDKVNYGNTIVAMTPVDAVTRSGVLEIPLEMVKDKKLVSFTYGKKESQLPLMAYITPKGMLVTAVSVCEPCKSTKFHIEGNNMVCNTCDTRWDLESLKGISGGCLKYPPDVIGHKIEGGKVRMKEMTILNWKPRV